MFQKVISNLVLDFVDGASNGGAEMLHANVNVFHCVVRVRIIEHERLLDLLVMVGQLLDLGAVAFDRCLNF